MQNGGRYNNKLGRTETKPCTYFLGRDVNKYLSVLVINPLHAELFKKENMCIWRSFAHTWYDTGCWSLDSI